MIPRIALACLLAAVPLVAGPAVAAAQQEQEKPKVPKDSLLVNVTGCLKGRVVRAEDVRQPDTTSGMTITNRSFRLAGKKDVRPINLRLVPNCTYCDPEVASVGLTEAKAKEQGYDVKVGRFPFSASGKARILGEEEGFVKIVSEKKYDEILGVHIIGPHATELIAEACVAMQLESTADELGRTIHAHPTVSEAVMEAAEGVHDLAVHI